MLLAQKAIAEGALALILECAQLVDEEQTATDDAARREASALLEVLTPIAKAWPGEAGQEAISLAMQTLGGYGFAREYPIEQYYRDNRLNPIHEGTNGVQALDLLGRKVTQDNGAGLRALLQRMRAVAADAGTCEEIAPLARQLHDAASQLERVTTTLLTNAATVEPARALANASVYLDMVSRTVIAWLWLRQATVALRASVRLAPATASGSSNVSSAEAAFYRGKVQAARYWFGWELTKTAPLAELLERADAVPYEMQNAWF
jgi:butyryl-CoA dehydrogenase